jgi:hypothetical protein
MIPLFKDAVLLTGIRVVQCQRIEETGGMDGLEDEIKSGGTAPRFLNIDIRRR